MPIPRVISGSVPIVIGCTVLYLTGATLVRPQFIQDYKDSVYAAEYERFLLRKAGLEVSVRPNALNAVVPGFSSRWKFDDIHDSASRPERALKKKAETDEKLANRLKYQLTSFPG